MTNDEIFTKAIDAKITEATLRGFLVVFDYCGMTCDDDCGWDGESNRCFCGNNRVCWTSDADLTDKERPQDYIYGTTY